MWRCGRSCGMWIPALDPHPVCISCLGVDHAPRFEATQKSTEAVKSFLPRREGTSRPTAQAPTMATHHVRARRRGAPHPQRQQQQQQQQQRPPGQQRDIYPPRQDRQSRRGWKRGRERSASRPAPTGQPQARLLGRSREVGEPFPKRARILQSDSSCAVALLYPQALVNKPPPSGGGFACGSPRPPSHAGSPSMVLSAQGQTQARSDGSEMLESSCLLAYPREPLSWSPAGESSPPAGGDYGCQPPWLGRSMRWVSDQGDMEQAATAFAHKCAGAHDSVPCAQAFSPAYSRASCVGEVGQHCDSGIHQSPGAVAISPSDEIATVGEVSSPLSPRREALCHIESGASIRK
ncbi:uncharacterized protein LOC121695718 [Alosa sapidissima]|uniref:uncharacterized protein LOC121695718 n=1 Tax=Alosa sapidissima TaxID=34773 RepID=UPI001C082C2D|nr:uncharacterized protein LOC121695718 [Alosa sapidissima]